MRTQEEVYKLAAKKYKEGSAVVDLKFREVFRFSQSTDAQVVVEWPNQFRSATEEEAKLLDQSGNSSVPLA